MKNLVFVLLITLNLGAQELSFTTKPILAENRWVAWLEKDGAYMFGFIYIDYAAGPTFHYEGSFKIGTDGSYELLEAQPKYASLKMRLQPNTASVAIIPPQKYKELGVQAEPDWLKIYKSDEKSIDRLQRWGNYYNHFGESEHALKFLDEAYKKDPDFEGVAFEMAFAYNVLKRYEDAIRVLKKALLKNPADCLLHKELIYAQANLSQLKDVVASYDKAVKSCGDKKTLAEMALNITYQYYLIKDSAGFERWAANTLKWATENDMFSRGVEAMRKDLKANASQ